MIIYFADRQLNILGHATTGLPDGLTITKDNKTEDVETGVNTFECTIPYNKANRSKVTEWTRLGNYILRSNDDVYELYTITDGETDTKKQTRYIYAEDDGMDLLNEVVGPYEADKAYPISHYINKYAAAAGFVIGVNEADSLSRQLGWDGESTATERIASIATQFGGCEVSYSFEVDGLYVAKKFINIYKKRGQDNGITLRLNYEIDNIVTTETITNLATALQCKGGTPEDDNLDDDVEPTAITLKGYEYDDGDFYIDGELLKSREALKQWSRYLWKTEESQKSGGHIVKQYSYDTLEQKTLCANAITELKKLRELEVNYKADVYDLKGAKIGDRINIVDDAGELYLSTRILLLETSVADQEIKATFGEYLLKNSGINNLVLNLAEQFARNSQSAARALMLTNKAQTAADEAQAEAEMAAHEAAAAVATADDAIAVADAATDAASAAQASANSASAAVMLVEENVESLEQSVSNAQIAANNAQVAAETAQAKANEAAHSAEAALAEAQEAKTSATNAQSTADNATTKATEAISTAGTAKTTAEEASAIAAAAKADAEQAGKDVDALADELDTLSQTMQADYTRKTDFTETTANLQSQITQNAAQIASTVSKVETIDETANDAQEKATAAQTAASTALTQADQAKADAQAAQTAADNAAAAATAAQNEADTAKTAAATAQSVADKAKADLEAAQADLATVTSRVDATEEEIIAAQKAVTAAKTAADNAQAEANSAVQKATEAQSTAGTAVTNAANAQTTANDAATQAALAQQVADEAKGDASAAQTKANEAVATAAEAQRTANDAVTNAANAQSKANEAAEAAAAAQSAADEADAKAAQAATDLATAQQNLANVTSRVDATEEEVESAKSAVNTAQAAADKAKQDAEAAQATANTAKTNAATAQTAANNAKTAADQAQAAAEEAQDAADKAQADVDALAVRVTTAETKITQNSEQISLMAKKTEVIETLGGYFTKEETKAAITLESDEIKSTVRENYATSDRVTTAESLIQQLSNCIAMLVTDENGESLMTQTESGWTFSMKETAEAVSSLSNLLETLQQETGSTKATVDTLQQAVSDQGETLEYVKVTTYEDEPCLELGESDSDFKLMATNTRIMFRYGSNIPTLVNTNGIVTQNIEVNGEIIQGGYVMLNTSDGGWGVLWKGVGS